MKRILMVFMLIFSISVSAQNLVTNGLEVPQTVNLCQAGDCYDLTASYFTPQDTGSSYTVNSIPFDPVAVAVPGGITEDDTYSGVVDLGFTFCFFGNNANQIVIGGNGNISFDLSLANQIYDWQFSDNVPSPNLPSGGIFGAFHDMDIAGAGGTITYGVTGTAPFRAFVINYEVGHFSCNDLVTKQQIVLHETSNFIDVYIEDKPVCTAWNDGNAVIGIQNIGGTIGFAPPGRNTTDSPWTTTNEAWRFAPDGAPTPVTFNWLDNGGTPISSNATVNVCPTADTFYTAQVEYTYCDGSIVTNTAQSNFVIGQGATVDLGVDRAVCFPYTLTAGGSFGAPVAYEWLQDGNVVSGATANTLDISAAGTYTVNVTYGNNCTTTNQVVITAASLTINTPNDLTQQDTDNDGIMTFDLTVNEPVIAGATTGLVFTYYETMADAQAATNAVTNTFTNVTNPDVIYVRVEDPATGCVEFTSFNLLVTSPMGSCFAAGPDQVIDCGIPCVDLTTNYTDGSVTSSYNVSSITYNPPAAFTGLANDLTAEFAASFGDQFSADIIDLPFTFSFFGNCYEQLVVGDNGVITFNTDLAGTACPYDAEPLPTNADPSYNNAIFGVQLDLHMGPTSTVTWEIMGTAPNRMFVVSFSEVGTYDCNNLQNTFQTVLYEGTNIVEVHIQDVQDCPGGFFTDGTVGVQSGDGLVGFAAPGRDGTTWNTTNESWRFEPNGPATTNATYTWYDGTTVVGTGSTINVCPTVDTTYLVELVNNDTNETFTDTVNVTVNGVDPVITGINGDLTFCGGLSSVLTVDSPDSNLTYQWAYKATATDTYQDLSGETNADITVTNFGFYQVTIQNTDGCSVSQEVAVTEALDCFLSEGISPNGDGVNDSLDAAFLADTAGVASLTIYNRYGTTVYEKANYRNEWSGQSDSGDELPTGTYFYVIKLKNPDPVYGSVIKKWVYLNREL